MEKNEYNDLRKIYIEEALKNRKYFGYRLDLVLIKLIITAFTSLAIYITTADFIFTVIIASEMFVLVTLINKILIDRKTKKGKILFIERLKKQKFKKKMFSSNCEEMDNFILLYLNLNRYYEVKKIDDNLYCTKKNNSLYYVNIIRLYDGAFVEKIDIRNIIVRASDDNIKDIMIITTNNLVEEAQKMIDDLNNVMNITIVCFNDLFNFVKENLLLSTAYEAILEDDLERKSKANTAEILSNIFNPAKIKIYIIAAIGFYMLYRMFLINELGIYASYYFLVVAALNLLYNCYRGIYGKKHSKKN